MHIPDGYLSPSTCAVLYAGSVPFWWGALRRVQTQLHTRLVPLISVFAAFSFVVMMFNLPLLGGTTAHAVGMGVAAVVLGPWAAILALSVALFIQAVFFKDGGVLAYGANSFNMAIVGSLVAYAVYRLLAGNCAVTDRRRVWAAGAAGYAAINASALCAAIEFGLQPVLFKDAGGAPLYCPYPLQIAIPAMMMGHLTLPGWAEMLISGGVVAYLQRSEPSLLKATAPGARPAAGVADAPEMAERGAWSATRPLWVVLAIMVALSPLGLLAAGRAWGEWSASDFKDPVARHAIAAASGGHAAPLVAPAGLERFSSLWSAPVPGYAPAFLKIAALGYMAAAALGVALIVLLFAALGWAARAQGSNRGAWLGRDGKVPIPGGGRRGDFVEGTLLSLLNVVESSLFAEETAAGPGLLQGLDARVKVVGALALILASALSHSLLTIGALFGAAVVLAICSKVSPGNLATRAWLGVLLFTGSIAVPALFVTPGQVVYRLPLVHWGVTAQGARSAAYLMARSETAATIAILLILCTPWTQVLKALRVLRVPVVFVVILGMTYRYIFLLLSTAQDMFEARRSRMVGNLDGPSRRRLAASGAGVLLGKSMQLSGEVYMAMQSRGFRGEVYTLDEFCMQRRDWVALGATLLVAAAAYWAGRA